MAGLHSLEPGKSLVHVNLIITVCVVLDTTRLGADHEVDFAVPAHVLCKQHHPNSKAF
jgi:hypothetical protein